MGENDNVIAIKIFFSESAPLFCKLVLQKVATVKATIMGGSRHYFSRAPGPDM